jgi:hypothetical protein
LGPKTSRIVWYIPISTDCLLGCLRTQSSIWTHSPSMDVDISGSMNHRCLTKRTGTQTHRQTDKQTHRHTDIDTQSHRHTGTQAHRHTDRETEREREKERQRHTLTNTNTHIQHKHKHQQTPFQTHLENNGDYQTTHFPSLQNCPTPPATTHRNQRNKPILHLSDNQTIVDLRKGWWGASSPRRWEPGGKEFKP